MIGVSTAFAEGRLMPVQGTSIAHSVDSLYYFLVIASTISCILLIGGMIYFAMKYRRKSDSDKVGTLTHSGLLEFTWSFVPFLIFMFVFGWGWYIYDQMRHPPKDAFEVHVVAKQWAWEFKYKSGKTSSNLVVPANTPVKLIMSSIDVLHSFYVPAFRIKQDVVPGMYTQVWFKSEMEGEFQIFCTEFCGTRHSEMLSKVLVLPQTEFEKWLGTDEYKGLSLLDIGKKLYTDKGCVACHSTSGVSGVGPSWKGVFGTLRKLDNGQEVAFDENYVRESVLTPSAKVLAGFKPGVMPTFQGSLSEQEITAIIEFLKSLK
ncbi:MAG: cytochrome C oxidase subunit II [Proteobacteria bacterium SG_bin7]|nr:MAG: cytochrome C oxidase subunit II [Proteobacteria bacterium SG_bin7]